MKETALDRMLKYHRTLCAHSVSSGDRHCSCGRDEALVEVARLRAIESGLTPHAADRATRPPKKSKGSAQPALPLM